MSTLPDDLCTVEVLCLAGQGVLQGANVQLLYADLRVTAATLTDSTGRAALTAPCGDYLLRVSQGQRSLTPAASYIRLTLLPGCPITHTVVFRRCVHRGGGRHMVMLEDCFYPERPLPGAVYQLWMRC